MLPSSNRGTGENIGSPDVCLTPPVPAPIPYVNLAENMQAVAFSPNVLLCAQNALNLGSIIPLTTGDEPGVAHWTVKGPSWFTSGNPFVFLNGLPAIDLTSPCVGNNANDPADLQAVPSATNVTYTFASAAALRALDALLPRDGSSVAHELREGGVAVLRVAVFSPDVPARAHAAITRMIGDGARSLVIDLRGNPGGELDAAVALAGDFLPEGSLVLTVRDHDGDELALRSHARTPWAMPLCLLVDAGTASAAELFAGSLAAHGRAIVAGARTYGKGVGASLARGADGALHALTATFTLPDGSSVHGAGVTPSVLLPAEETIAHAAELLQHVR